jgi:hypothetical protein
MVFPNHYATTDLQKIAPHQTGVPPVQQQYQTRRLVATCILMESKIAHTS